MGIRGRVRDVTSEMLALTARRMELGMVPRMWPLFSAHSAVGELPCSRLSYCMQSIPWELCTKASGIHRRLAS